jgi:epoxide hydrolase-like predicted phosphatase
MIKAIIFDCFGVLVADAMRPRADEIAKTDPSVAETIYGVMRELDLNFISQEQGHAELAQALHMTPQGVAQLSQQGEVRNAGLIEHIPELHLHYKIGLLSNIQSRQRLEQRFLPGELDVLFDDVIASGDVGMIKPDPAIYRLMADKLGVSPEECVMIDDRQSSIEGARGVGMSAIQYHSTQQVMEELRALLAG